MRDDVKATLRQDPIMATLIDEHGHIETVPAENEFERLCVSIINQQLSTASAAAVRDRVFALLDEVAPETVLAADKDVLRDAGLSRTKVEYMKNAAVAFQEQDLTRSGLANHTDEEIIDLLTEIKGVGEWTARMYLLFVIGHEDVLPLGDLGIRNGLTQIYNDGKEMTREEMRQVAEQWRPYRSHAIRYIWREYESDD